MFKLYFEAPSVGPRPLFAYNDLATVRIAGEEAVRLEADRACFVLSRTGMENVAEAMTGRAAKDGEDAVSYAMDELADNACGQFGIGTDLRGSRVLAVQSILVDVRRERYCADFFEDAWSRKRAAAFLTAAFWMAKREGVRMITVTDDVTTGGDGIHYSARETLLKEDGRRFYEKFKFRYTHMDDETVKEHLGNQREAVRNAFLSHPIDDRQLKAAVEAWTEIVGSWGAALDTSKYSDHIAWMQECRKAGAWMPNSIVVETSHVGVEDSGAIAEIARGMRDYTQEHPGEKGEAGKLAKRQRVSRGIASFSMKLSAGHSHGMPGLHLLAI